MYRGENGTVIITGKDILRWFSSPLGLFICGIICSAIAFNTGIKYSQRHVKVNSIIQHYAFIEIAGQEHMYELDWTEPEPIHWGK